MAKSIRHELVYAGTTVDRIAELVCDPAFREAVADYQRTLRNAVSVEDVGGARQVVVELVHGTERVPSFARKLVGDEIAIVQTEDWRDAAAEIRVEIPGKPGDVQGRARISQRGDDVVESVELTVKVSIPLLGGRIEELISGLLVKALNAENKVGVKWLAGEWEPRG
jgi:hypothetical protein